MRQPGCEWGMGNNWLVILSDMGLHWVYEILFSVLRRGKYSEHSWSLCAAYMVICSSNN